MSDVLAFQKLHIHNARKFVESFLDDSEEHSGIMSIDNGGLVATSAANVAMFLQPGEIVTANGESRQVTNVASNGTSFGINVAFSTALSDTQFTSHSLVPAYDSYYVFIGRPMPWSGGDATPDTIVDSIEQTHEYWNDVIAVHRVTTADFSLVIPRHDWVANGTYSMHDNHVDRRELFANASSPLVIVTSNMDVFKCVFDGRSNSTSGPSISTTEPTIAGQSDLTALTYSAGVPYSYVWKYLYTIDDPAQLRHVTPDFIPVKSSWDRLNANGDVFNDGSNQFLVFDKARTSGNGSILRVVIDTQGSGYTNPPSVLIGGDGTGATATAEISSGQVSAINMISEGQNYSFATATIAANGESNGASIVAATATPILQPRNMFKNTSGTFYVSNHGISLPEEFGARYVMLTVDLVGRDAANVVSVGNDYRRIGLIRNPLLYGTNTVANGNVYSMTTDLTIASTSGAFTLDEMVWQTSTNATGVVVEVNGSILRLSGVRGTFSTSGNTYIVGIGNGESGGQLAPGPVTIPSTPGAFSPSVANSGASGFVTTIIPPGLQPYSGDVLLVDHRVPITRADDQTEIIRTILTF